MAGRAPVGSGKSPVKSLAENLSPTPTRISRGSTESEWGHAAINKLLDGLAQKFPDAVKRGQQINETEAALHKAGSCSSAMGVPCPLKSRMFHPESVMGSQAAMLLGERQKTVWPDFKNPGLHSSMYVAPRPMTDGKKAELREYTKNRPRDVGDEVAVLLRECASLNAVYVAGAKYLKVKESDLRKRYAHLNPGQQRMVIGNRMRAVMKKKRERS